MLKAAKNLGSFTCILTYMTGHYQGRIMYKTIVIFAVKLKTRLSSVPKGIFIANFCVRFMILQSTFIQLFHSAIYITLFNLHFSVKNKLANYSHYILMDG